MIMHFYLLAKNKIGLTKLDPVTFPVLKTPKTYKRIEICLYYRDSEKLLLWKSYKKQVL